MDDLISEFITETTESIGLLDQELVRLEQNPNDQEILGNIFRLVHTIKGTCGFLGLPRLASVAHAGENVLGKIRDGEIVVTPEAISMVLEALDCIKDLIEFLSANGNEPSGDDSDLIARLNAFAEGASAAPAQPPATPEPDAPAIEAPVSVANADASPFSQEEMDALERAFAEATPTIEGFEGGTSASDYINSFVVADEAPAENNSLAPVATPAAAPAPTAAAPSIGKSAEEQAIKQGLETPVTKDAGAASSQQTIRVSIDVLEDLMQMVGELVLTRNQLLQVTREREERELQAPLQQLSQITSELQDGIMKTRMQPISGAWSKFPRLIRDLSLELNKKIELKMLGETTEVDRQVLEAIKDPLTHMVRNSCDHGLETPEDRLASGKPETGTVTLSARHEGGYIIIEIADDGRGINLERVKQKAVENGLATTEQLAMLSDEQILQFIFKAGFSTAEKVTSVSGRGVGMDVVRTNIEKIGGAVSLRSVTGKGSTFDIKIPLTLAIVSVLIVESRGRRFAVPQLNVSELVSVAEDSEYKIEEIHGARVLRLREKLLPMLSLGDTLQLSAASDVARDEQEQYTAIIKVGANEFGVLVDRVHDTEEIVVKPTSRVLENVDVYAGNTILGDGSVIMILDPNGLAKTLGNEEAPAKQIDTADTQQKVRTTSYLLFETNVGAQKGVPLELVSRLEEIDAARIEYSGSTPVVQYRGDLMQIRGVSGGSLPQAGMVNVVVFSYDGRSIGLLVNRIIDIVRAPVDMQMPSTDDFYIGSLIISDKTTDIIDVAHLIHSCTLQHATKPSVAGIEALRILYVEDSPFFRNLTVNYFKTIGMNVTSASSASEGLAILSKTNGGFDAIVTDIEMPEMNGFEFAVQLRQIAGNASTPIYAFTSTVNEETLKRAHDSGMKGVINKTNRDALIESLQSLANAEQEVA